MSTNTRTSWPELPTASWRDTYATLHLLTQTVGKIRLSRTPWLNHSWHVTLYVTARGLSTSPVPDGDEHFEIEFDFIDHVLRISSKYPPAKPGALGIAPLKAALIDHAHYTHSMTRSCTNGTDTLRLHLVTCLA